MGDGVCLFGRFEMVGMGIIELRGVRKKDIFCFVRDGRLSSGLTYEVFCISLEYSID